MRTSAGFGGVEAYLAQIRWCVLKDLMRTAEAIYGEVKEAREHMKVGAPVGVGTGWGGKRRPEERLQARNLR